VTPEVSAHLGAGAHLDAAGNVSVTAELDNSVPGAPSSDGTGAITSVDTSTDQLGVGLPLQTGDVVQYDANGGTDIGGLQSGRDYNVLGVPGSTSAIQLGNAFNASTIDPNTDTITFATPH